MHKADNLPPSCAVVMKSGSLNFLEPSGNGTALPLSLIFNFVAIRQMGEGFDQSGHLHTYPR